MKSPRPGSRKAAVFSAFQQDGERAALDKGATLKLAVGTIRSWLNKWRKSVDTSAKSVVKLPNFITKTPKSVDKLVYEVTYPLTTGVIIKKGEQVSEVVWGHKTPWGTRSFVQNKYLRPVSVKPATVE